MVRSGDWIVPRQQGLVFADRPPLNSWCMALIYEITGRLDRLAIRLPTALATLLTTLLVYVYSRTFLSRLGALTAGAAYATAPQVLQLGRFAESDALFSLFGAASLLVWHLGYTRKWPPVCVWCSGYLLAALAALTKGPQGPIYFLGPVLIFLLLRRDWRYLLSLPHLAGIAALAAVVGAWQIPFTLRTGLEATAKVWSEKGGLADRVRGILDGSLPLHLVAFPAKVFLYMAALVGHAAGLRQPPVPAVVAGGGSSGAVPGGLVPGGLSQLLAGAHREAAVPDVGLSLLGLPDRPGGPRVLRNFGSRWMAKASGRGTWRLWR